MTKRVLLYFALLLWFVVPVTAQPTIFIEDISIEPESKIDLKVKVLAFTDVAGMQFSVNWDADFLAFDSVSVSDSGALPIYNPAANFNTTLSNQGKLTTLWVDPALSGVSLADSTSIFSIHFSVLGAAGTSSEVNVTDDPTDIELSTENGTILDVSVESGTVTVLEANGLNDLLIQSNNAFTLYQNEPNPFDNQTFIKFDVHKPSDFVLEVFDAKGTVVYTKEAYYLQGSQLITLNREMLPTTGVFIYKLKTKDYFITNRMILVR